MFSKREKQTEKEVYSQEIKKEKRLKNYKISSFLIFFISTILLLSLTFIGSDQMTGMISYISSKAGDITELILYREFGVDLWGGFYGFAISLSGVGQQFSEDLPSGTITRADVFLECLQADAPGGPEFFASTAETLDFGTVAGATYEEIDSFTGCTTQAYCASDTFVQNGSVMIGISNITGVPTTYTYRYDGSAETFKISALNVSGELAFATIVQGIQKGYNPNISVNYQMLLPTPANTTQTYYFHSDPNDECPSGGLGNSINSSLYGYVFDEDNNTITGASVNVAGSADSTNTTGFYNVTFDVLPGTYNVIVTKTGYQTLISNITINYSAYALHRNYTLELEQQALGSIVVTAAVTGYVTNAAGTAIEGATVAVGNATTASNSAGYYGLITSVIEGEHPIIAYKTGYDNYYDYISLNATNTDVSHNITMEAANLNAYPTGPYTVEKRSNKRFDEVKRTAEEAGQDYWISAREINKNVLYGTFVDEIIGLYNFKTTTMTLTFALSSNIADFVKLDKNSITIPSNSEEELTMTIYGTKELGTYEGTLSVGGDIEQEVKVKITIVDDRVDVQILIIVIDLLKKVVSPGKELKYKVGLQNLLADQNYQVKLNKYLVSPQGEIIAQGEEEVLEVVRAHTIVRKDILVPEDLEPGDYILRITAEDDIQNAQFVAEAPLKVAKPFLQNTFFGIPIWLLLVLISAISFLLFNFFMYKHYKEKRKRYHLALNTSLLPKDGPRSITLGKIAETNIQAYYDLDMLTTHAIIAGATGGGKSIAAQVLIEEALKKNIAVIVFDPTAQWSGMLRKCEDKKMLSFYPKFKMKPSDARSFPGNVRQVTNERQKIDVSKYMNPGQIQVFTLNKLDPSKMDVFVAGVIAEIFRSDPKEHPGLKTILVFDEVHRLLPKFGGSGKGFLQIERACREFRKWGLGVMLVSQVLSDFVGEIKANINTELQMRVAEENDLARIKERYGLEALKSLVRADIGVGMFQNAEYNRGLPYFVNLRPILHSTRRLSDEVLEKYNQYGETIEDLEYQVEQLEKEKVDTFDLKMELKLVKDKLMTGNFTVVDIYLEGLKPRLTKQWEKIGKTPKKKEIELVDLKAMDESLQRAKADRQKWNKKTGKPAEEEKEEKKIGNEEKIVRAFTFDNGMMVSSLKEMRDVLPTVDAGVFKLHVTEEKNQIAEWVEKEIDPKLGAAMKELKTKDEMTSKIKEIFEKKEKKAEGDEGEGEKKEEPEKEKARPEGEKLEPEGEIKEESEGEKDEPEEEKAEEPEEEEKAEGEIKEESEGEKDEPEEEKVEPEKEKVEPEEEKVEPEKEKARPEGEKSEPEEETEEGEKDEKAEGKKE